MLKRIEDYLQSNYINVPKEWIPACIEFIKDEHGNNNLSNYGWLKDKVYEQWLHADLTDLGTNCLPFNINNEKCITIKGHYALQINHIKDVGLPAYSQLQKLRKDDIGNANVSADKVHTAAWEPKPSRMLLLQLTDGTRVVQGMEYRPINTLSLSMKPGTKILLKGVIEIRRGMLLLMRDHVTVLGGEVESLNVPNAPENVLRRALRLEESEEPIAIPEAFASNSSQFDLTQTQSQYYNTQSTQNSVVNTSNSRIQNSFVNSRPKATVNPTYTSSAIIDNNFVDDFEDFMDAETEMALIEAEERASSSLRPLNQSSQWSGNKPDIRPVGQSSRWSSNMSGNPIASCSTSSLNQNELKFNNCSQSSEVINLDDFEDDDDDLLLAAAEVNVFPSNASQCNSVLAANDNHFTNSTAKKDAAFSLPFTKRNSLTGTTAMNNLCTSNYKSEGNWSKMQPKPQEKTLFSSTSQINSKSKFQPPSLSKPQNSGKETLRQTKLSSFIFEKKNRSEDNTKKIVTPERQDLKCLLGSKTPFQYIYFMNQHPTEKVSYVIKGFVTTLLSKLEQNDGKWSLAVKINDGSGSCDADIEDQVLRKLIGLSLEEFTEQKQKAFDDPQLRAALGQRVYKCQMELIRMCCLLKLEKSPFDTRARVTELIELTDEHLLQLRARSQQLARV